MNFLRNIIKKKVFPKFNVEILSVGKYKNNSSLNEDAWLVKDSTFAVIDGSAPRVPIAYDGKTSGKFAAEVVKDILSTTHPKINGKDLIDLITNKFNEKIGKLGLEEIIKENVSSRPAALFTCAKIIKDQLIITSLGDVGCRINGKVVHKETIKTELIMTKKRINAMKRAYLKNPKIRKPELIKIGQESINNDLKTQVINYFNNPNSKLGIGIIDGRRVPDKFIRTYKFDLNKIKSLEIFSDGYYVLPEKAKIESWEKVFLQAEKIDPLRWRIYPAVKSANNGKFSDDRTILILTFKNYLV